jgi:predicted RNA binding protein YcfA (HicA-like mRNA interferase family)
MPRFGPISRRDLITALQRLGFDGPYSGGKHQFMIRGERTVRVPNPHTGDIGRELLTRILRQAGVSRGMGRSELTRFLDVLVRPRTTTTGILGRLHNESVILTGGFARARGCVTTAV